MNSGMRDSFRLLQRPELRRDTMADLIKRWNTYAYPDGFLSPPRFVDPKDQALTVAISIIELVQALDKLEPVHSVTLGRKTEAATETEKLLQRMSSVLSGRESQQLESLQGPLVKRARALGISWQRIGDACGISAPGIYKRSKQHNWVGEFEPDLEQ